MTQAKTSAKGAVAPSTSKRTAAKKPTAGRSTASGKRAPVEHAKRHEMIAETAYFRAESSDFKGDPMDHWLEAERAIDAMLCGDAGADPVEG